MAAKQTGFADLLNTAVTQGNPIGALRAFLDNETKYEKAKLVDKMTLAFRSLRRC